MLTLIYLIFRKTDWTEYGENKTVIESQNASLVLTV